MSQDLVIIPNDMPAYLQTTANAENAMLENADFMDGIGLGAPPALKLSGTRFVLRESDGSTTTIDATKINVVVIKGRPGLKKLFYVQQYDPNSSEAKAPDCYSDDGIRPNQGCSLPQAEACAGCPNNAFGTGKNDKGEFTDGKACRDLKVLAILYEGKVYEFDLPPASLKKFGSFAKTLTDRGIPVYGVATTLGFDPDVVYAKVTFAFGGWLPEALIAQIVALRDSAEVKDIIEPRAQPARVAAPATQPVVAPVAVEPPAVVPVTPAPVAPPVQEAAPVAAPVVPAPVAPPVQEAAPVAAPIVPAPVAAPVVAPVQEAAPIAPAPVAAPVAAPVEAYEPPPVTVSTGGADNRGVIWASGHHAENKAQNQDGSWKARRGCDKDALAAYEAQFAAQPAPVAAAHVAPAAAPIAAPLTATPALAPVAAPVAAQPVPASDADLRNELGL